MQLLRTWNPFALMSSCMLALAKSPLTESATWISYMSKKCTLANSGCSISFNQYGIVFISKISSEYFLYSTHIVIMIILCSFSSLLAMNYIRSSFQKIFGSITCIVNYGDSSSLSAEFENCRRRVRKYLPTRYSDARQLYWTSNSLLFHYKFFQRLITSLPWLNSWIGSKSWRPSALVIVD